MVLAAELFPAETIIDPADIPEVTYIEAVVADFMRMHRNVGQSLERALTVLGLVNNLRSEVGISKYRPTSDLLPVLSAKNRLDCLEWSAWNNLRYYDTPAEGHRGQSFAGRVRAEEFVADRRLFEDLALTHEQNLGNETVVYNDLIESFYLARLAVKNPPGLLSQEKALDKGMLDQKLTVYRVANALQSSGFTRARLSTFDERKRGIHAVVPVGKSETRFINLEVQPGSPRGSGLETQYTNSRLYVNAPYDTGVQNPFVMAPEDKKTLVTDLNYARRRKLAYDTGVKLSIVRPVK